MSTPVPPALVRAIMKPNSEMTREDLYMVANWMLSGSGHRSPGDLYREHIRATAAEMRERARNLSNLADCGSYNTDEGMLIHDHANELREYANKLEGIES